MMDHNPSSLRSWIDYIAAQYARKGKCAVDADQLFREVIVELPQQQNQKSWRPKKILLVDDEMLFNFLYKRLLELTGVADKIHISLNGAQALDFLTKALTENLGCDLARFKHARNGRFFFSGYFRQSGCARKGEYFNRSDHIITRAAGSPSLKN